MRTYHARTGEPEFTELTDFPAPGETLDDLEKAERQPHARGHGGFAFANLQELSRLSLWKTNRCAPTARSGNSSI